MDNLPIPPAPPVAPPPTAPLPPAPPVASPVAVNKNPAIRAAVAPGLPIPPAPPVAPVTPAVLNQDGFVAGEEVTTEQLQKHFAEQRKAEKGD